MTGPASAVGVLLPDRPARGGFTVDVRVTDAGTSGPWMRQLQGSLTPLSRSGDPPGRSARTSNTPPSLSADPLGLSKHRGLVLEPGLVRFSSVPEGAYDVVVSSQGVAPWVLRQFTVDEQSVAKPLEARLGGGVSLEGRLVSTRAAALRGIMVLATREDGSSGSTFADAEGRFTMTGLLPGSWELSVSHLADPMLVTAQPVAVTIGKTPMPVTVTLVEPVLTSVYVTYSRRNPARGGATTRPAPLEIVLETSDGKVLGRSSHQAESEGIACPSFPVAPQPVKAVVRAGGKVIAIHETTAGSEIRLTVTID
jgi:hypothetical protein